MPNPFAALGSDDEDTPTTVAPTKEVAAKPAAKAAAPAKQQQPRDDNKRGTSAFLTSTLGFHDSSLPWNV
jgi:hypothetical protein